MALLRRMILIDADGNLVPSPLVETVQLRVYREVPQAEGRVVERAAREQDFVEFEMHRGDLFASKAGGLRPLGRGERRRMSFPASQMHVFRDPFTAPEGAAPPEGSIVMGSCPVCHAGSGIHSVMSFSRRDAYASSVAEQDQWASYFKRERYDWGVLTGIWQAGGR